MDIFARVGGVLELVVLVLILVLWRISIEVSADAGGLVFLYNWFGI